MTEAPLRQSSGEVCTFHRAYLGIGCDNALEAGLAGIKALRKRFKSWGMPVTLKEMGVPKEDIDFIATAIVNSPKGACLERDDVLKVLIDCYEYALKSNNRYAYENPL